MSTLRKHYRPVYLLPFLHLGLCALLCVTDLLGYLIPPLQPLMIGTEILIWLDFPISLLTIGLAMSGRGLLALGWLFVTGSLWWYGLSLAARALFGVFADPAKSD